jgi:hypothetical protein
VVEQDFAPALSNLRGFLQRHEAELGQWREAAGVTPTLGALMALLRFFQGLAPGREFQKGDRRRIFGVGLQVPLRFLATVLNRNKNTVCEAKALGVDLGFLACYSPIRRVANVTRHRGPEAQLHQVTTRDGVERSRVHVHGVIYLTPAGAAWLDRRGTTRAELRDRNPRQAGRGRVLTGILWDVLRTCAQVRRHVAARFSSGQIEATPEERALPLDHKSVVGRPVGNLANPERGAVRPEAEVVGSGTGRALEGARDIGCATAPPAPRSGPTERSRGLQGSSSGDAGLSGGGALSPDPGKPRGVGYGPPLRPGVYLDAETERCWRQHVVVEGGPPRRIWVRSYGVGEQFLGYTERWAAGRVLVWRPALTAPVAYPGEWQAAKGLLVVRAQLEADFRMYLGPRLTRRLLAREELRRTGVPVRCPVEGCVCQDR